MPGIEVIVAPTLRSVHLGQDASFSCEASKVMDRNMMYSWQIPRLILDSGRYRNDDRKKTLTILDTAAADNNTDFTCIVTDRGNTQNHGYGTARLMVLPVLPSTDPPTPTPELITEATVVGKTTTESHTVTQTVTLSTTVAETTTMSPSTSSSVTTTAPTTTERPTTAAQPTTVSSSTRVPSKMPIGPHEGPTQKTAVESPIHIGIVAPAVVGGIVLLLIVLVTSLFLMRRSRRKSRCGNIENGAKQTDHHMYEFISPNSLDSIDGENSDEENHNKKRHGNSHINRDSLRTYSRGTASDTIARYSQVVPKKDRIVNIGGHGCKPRREPVLTLSMNSLYEETTPTFVVTNGYVDELPNKQKGNAVDILRGALTDGEDEDQYVTLAQNSPLRESSQL